MEQLTPVIIRSIIAAARRENRALAIRGYVDTKGSIQDFVVELLPPSGYDKMVADSLSVVEGWALADAIAACGVVHNPDGTDEMPPLDLLTQCLEELKTSWRTRLDTPKNERELRDNKLDKHSDGWYLPKDDSECTVLMGLRRISSELVKPASVSMAKPMKWQKTVVKDRLVKALPLGAYLGRLNLRPTNIADLQLDVSLA
jgi:hypothetical protein